MREGAVGLPKDQPQGSSRAHQEAQQARWIGEPSRQPDPKGIANESRDGPDLGHRIGPAASSRSTVSVCGTVVPAEATLCLDLSAARSAYGRRSGKNAHTTLTDVHEVLKLPEGCSADRAFKLLDAFAPWLKLASLRDDAHCPATFPFKCKRPGCGVTLKSAAEREAAKAELALLKADRTVGGKKLYAKAIAVHADLHGQQMPLQAPVTAIPTLQSILDLLHAIDLNLAKVGPTTCLHHMFSPHAFTTCFHHMFSPHVFTTRVQFYRTSA